MNKPTRSKINFTALGQQVFTIVLLAGLVPDKYGVASLAIIGLVMPAMVQVFRTWYTISGDL